MNSFNQEKCGVAFLSLVILLYLVEMGSQFILPPTAQTAAAIDAGLVGHYTLDEGTATGKIGQAVDFNGTSTLIPIANPPAVTAPFTISLWVNPRQLGVNGGLINFGANGRNLFITSGNRIELDLYSSGNFRTFCNRTLTSADLNTWWLLTLVVTSPTDASQWKCYVNSVDVGVEGYSTGVYVNPATTNWKIGNNALSNGFFNGLLDDVRVYDHALTAQEVADLAGEAAPVVVPPANNPPVTAPYVKSGSTYTVNSCNQPDVQTAINDASSGATIQVPAGNCTWTVGVNITKPLTIIGAGMGGGVTKLTANGTLSDKGFFYIHDVSSNELMRISGFTFDMVTFDSYKVAINIVGNVALSMVRIDHNTFNYGYEQINVGGSKGVIDHNDFYNSRKAISFTAGSAAEANESWMSLAAGTGEALFVENNRFIDNESYPATYTQEKIGTFNGGKLVVRYNEFDFDKIPGTNLSDVVMTHGNAPAGLSADKGYWQQGFGARRGQSVVEIYNNNMHGKRIGYMATLRGSANLVFNNTLTNTIETTPRIYLREEESTVSWSPSRTAWPAEDQVHNTFIWSNTFNGKAQTSANIVTGDLPVNIIENRDYFLHAPQATGGKEQFVCVNGVTQCNGASGSYPTDGIKYPTVGTMVFTPEGPNAYYPYTPYVYPHPLVSGIAAPASPPPVVPPAPVNSITASSCSYTDVSTAVASINSGGTVQVPSGNCTWSQTLLITKPVVLKGGLGGETYISGTIIPLIKYTPTTPSSSNRFRVTGFTFYDFASGNTGILTLQQKTTTPEFIRIDHNIFTTRTSRATYIEGTIYGVVDNNTFNNQEVTGSLTSTYGNDGIQWNAFGSSRAFGDAYNLFYEDNTYTTNANGIMNDGGQGGRYVSRYNSFTGNFGYIYDWHGNQPGGCYGNSSCGNASTMITEIYGNLWSRTTPGYLNGVIGARGGMTMFFMNKLKTDTTGKSQMLLREEYSDDLWPVNSGWIQHITNSYYWSNWNDRTNGPALLYAELTSEDCGADPATPWLPNNLYGSGPTSDIYCQRFTNDQNGNVWKKSQYTSPMVAPYLTGSTEPNWASVAPRYTIRDGNINWLNMGKGTPIYENVDFFNMKAGTFDGTGNSGGAVGAGPLSARPSTCVIGFGYWATNQSVTSIDGMVGPHPATPISGTLYKCTAPNTWTAYYTPYTYPHPLRSDAPYNPGSPGQSYIPLPIQAPMTQVIQGDFNKDGLVNSIDLSLLSGAWNQSNALYDLNKDGMVNTLDYSIMVRNWSV